jgi:hypothetical protein
VLESEEARISCLNVFRNYSFTKSMLFSLKIIRDSDKF